MANGRAVGLRRILWAEDANVFVGQPLLNEQIKPTVELDFWPADLNRLSKVEDQALSRSAASLLFPLATLLDHAHFHPQGMGARFPN